MHMCKREIDRKGEKERQTDKERNRERHKDKHRDRDRQTGICIQTDMERKGGVCTFIILLNFFVFVEHL